MTGHLQRFIAELQRRKVLRIAAAYVVGAWIVLQVALALQTAMSLSGQFSATMLALISHSPSQLRVIIYDLSTR